MKSVRPANIPVQLMRFAELDIRPVRIRMHPRNIMELRAMWRLPDGRFATDGSEIYGLPLVADESLEDGEARFEISAGIGMTFEEANDE